MSYFNFWEYLKDHEHSCNIMFSKRYEGIINYVDTMKTNKMKGYKKLLSKYLRRRTERTWYLYLNGDINAQERDEMLFKFQTLRTKWIRDECHHICLWCKYKHECWMEARENLIP